MEPCVRNVDATGWTFLDIRARNVSSLLFTRPERAQMRERDGNGRQRWLKTGGALPVGVRASPFPPDKWALAKSMHSPKRTVRDYSRCPECGITWAVDFVLLKPGMQEHPDNGCKLALVHGVMET